MANVEHITALLNVLELDNAKIQAIVEIGGVTSAMKMANMREKEISDLIKMLSSISVIRGGVLIGIADVRYLNGLAFWLRDMKRRGQDLNNIDPDIFTVDVCEDAITKMDFENQDAKSTEATKALNPGKIKDGRGWPRCNGVFLSCHKARQERIYTD